MNARPAGLSSDEDDEFDGFSFSNSYDDKIIHENSHSQYIYQDESDMLKSRRSPDNQISAMEHLRYAILSGKLESVKQALNNDLDINSEIVSIQWTPLLYASSFASPNIIAYLLKEGANPNIHKDLYTPLMAVCSCDSKLTATILECAQLLLDYGAKVDTADKYGMTPLMFASFHGRDTVVKLLAPHSYIEAADTQGWTALFYAVSRNHRHVIEVLLSENARIDKRDSHNMTARELAIQKGFLEAADMVTHESEREIFSAEEFENIETVSKWHDMFPGLYENEQPAYFDDIRCFLYGVNLERYVPTLQKLKVDFGTFLCVTDGELESYGFHLPFERRKILHSLHKYHEHRWNKKSINPIPSSFCVFDGLLMMGMAVKHLTILTSTIKFLNKRLEKGVNVSVNFESENKEKDFVRDLAAAQRNLMAIKRTMLRLESAAKNLEKNTVPPADYITPDKFKIEKNVFKKRIVYYGTLSVITLCLVGKYKFIIGILKSKCFSVFQKN